MIRTTTSRWPDAVWARVKALVAEGKTYKEIADIIGNGYTPEAISNKFKWENMSPEAKKAKNERSKKNRDYKLRSEKRRQREYQDAPRLQLERTMAAHKPSPELLADRDFRASLMPRDLTAAFFGDPLPGFSALDRRQ